MCGNEVDRKKLLEEGAFDLSKILIELTSLDKLRRCYRLLFVKYSSPSCFNTDHNSNSLNTSARCIEKILEHLWASILTDCNKVQSDLVISMTIISNITITR